MHLRRTTLALILAAVAVAGLARPAGAIHLFPLAPGDPGGDCAAALEPDPDTAATHVAVAGIRFTDDATGGPVSHIGAGDSVTWRWDFPHCHSVTFSSEAVRSTHGGPPGGFSGDEPQLVKPSGSGETFTVTFATPGTYDYFCVHHASVGMTGTVIVSSS